MVLRVTVLCALVLCALPLAPAPASTVRLCGSIAFERNSENGVSAIRAKGTTCSRARRVAERSRNTGPTRGPYAYSAFGYRCRGHLDRTQYLPLARWSCTRGPARVTFLRG